MNPKLKLVIDLKTEIEHARWFVKNGEYVDWFLPLNFQYITSKKFSLLERNKIIAEYTKHIHKIDQKIILKGVNEIRKQWAKTENNFYNLTNDIFKGHPWPEGKYIGYASIYLMFPRDIGDKTFSFPYYQGRCNPLRTIAHELLHFIFFDYIKKKYKTAENTKFSGKNHKYVWQVSETFNTVIENWKPYKNIFKTQGNCKPYPGCEKMYALMTKQWAKKQDIEIFLNQWLLR